MMRRLQVGEKIGDYSIVGFLGAGGMGEVYQGVHTKINRAAAIKVLSNYANNPMFITRFFNEARVQSSLQHPNIAALYDFQEINNQLYIFMEYADGERLEDLIARRAFTVEDALKTFESICEAIAFIHRNGIVHRDIKAQNVKLTSTGTVKLLDFGIAKDAASQRLTKIGGLIGTPHYLAPEQLAGKEGSPQTDIWALGVLFYEVLTGSEPFKSDTFGELHSQISNGNFEAPEKLNPAVSRQVSQIVARCLEKKPQDRYQTVDEILADVRQVLRREKPHPAFSLKRLAGFSQNSASENQTGNNSQNRSPGYDSLGQNSSSQKTFPYAVVAITSVGAVLLMFGVVGLGIWAVSSSDTNTVSNTILVQNSSTPKPISSRNAKPAREQNGFNAEVTRVRLDTNEGSAQVFRNNQLVGATPFEVEGRDGETVIVTLKREGYESQDVPVDITTRRKVVTVSLKPKR
jgi:serine/threonine-protein kinase